MFIDDPLTDPKENQKSRSYVKVVKTILASNYYLKLA